jgi:hypothetical protein
MRRGSELLPSAKQTLVERPSIVKKSAFVPNAKNCYHFHPITRINGIKEKTNQNAGNVLKSYLLKKLNSNHPSRKKNWMLPKKKFEKPNRVVILPWFWKQSQS